MNIPEYRTKNGKVLDLREFEKNKHILGIEGTDKNEFSDYVDKLISNGYEYEFKNEIPYVGEDETDSNLFYILKGKNDNAYAAYFPAIARAHVIFDSVSKLHSHEIIPDGGVSPSITQCAHVFGMSYCIKLSDESLIIIDGGYREKMYEKELCRIIRENTPKGKDKAVVSMWFFTHMDPDHILLAGDFLRDYKDLVDVKGFALSYPLDFEYGYSPKEEINAHVDYLKSSMKESFPFAPLYPLYAGDMFSFAGLKVQVLCCFDLMHPRASYSPNCESASFRFEFDGGKNAVFLGDSVTEASQRIALVYGKYLKSDILQVAHHGLIGGDLELYRLIDPDVCFWPVMRERFEGTHQKEKHHYCLGEGGFEFNRWIRDNTVKERKHYHSSTTVCVDVNTLEARLSEHVKKYEFKIGVSDDLMYVYSPACKEQKCFLLDEGFVKNSFNESLNMYDYISVVTKKKYTYSTTARAVFSFEKYGAPLIVISGDIKDIDGVKTYGRHYEAVAYENGINVWRVEPFPENKEHPVKSEKIGFLEFRVEENTPLELEVTVEKGMLTVKMCGKALKVTDENIPEEFHVGVTACEGLNKLYDLCIHDADL